MMLNDSDDLEFDKQDEVRLKWREQIERGWLQARAGQLTEGLEVIAGIKRRLKRSGCG